MKEDHFLGITEAYDKLKFKYEKLLKFCKYIADLECDEAILRDHTYMDQSARDALQARELLRELGVLGE